MKSSSFGFTLIEVIAILVVGAILAAMTMPYFYSGVLSQATPATRLVVSTKLNNAMETIVSDFYTNSSFSTKNSTTLTNFATKVNSFSTNYGSSCSTCTATAATNATVGSLTTVVLVTITSENNEKIYRVFTIQSN